jgi:hypothetical protein
MLAGPVLLKGMPSVRDSVAQTAYGAQSNNPIGWVHLRKAKKPTCQTFRWRWAWFRTY